MPRRRVCAVALTVSALTGSAFACCGVGPRGKPVVFGDQTNIVIWDEVHQVEHFIRNARFTSGAEDFGFIAPTPSKPELHEASTQAFYTLAALGPRPQIGRSAGGGFGGASSGAGKVKVIQEADVAGYHAATLRSLDAHAITDWMNEHGYVSTPDVQNWAEHYCKKGWYLTAFKVLDKKRAETSTGTIRMSFQTNRPFNPFVVPKANLPTNGAGTLRVYFVATGNYDARIGAIEKWKLPQWTAPMPKDAAAMLAKQVNIPAEAMPDNAQVEAFVDDNFPRSAADDIYFTKKRSFEPMAKPAAHATRELAPYFLAPTLISMGLALVSRHRRTK